jgi:hypothetical protein
MDRRQFFGAAALPLLGGVPVAAQAAPVSATRQFARVFNIVLNRPLSGQVPWFVTRRLLLLASYNKTDDFSLETFPLLEGGLGEYLAVRRGGSADRQGEEVIRFGIDTIGIHLGVPGLRSFENNEFFIAIGGDISEHWRYIKANNPWMHPGQNKDFRVVEDRDCTILTWTNNG